MQPIKGYEGLYSVTASGNVYSHPKDNNANRSGKWLKKTLDIKGYETVTFTKNYSRKTYKVHRLIAETFLEEAGEQINHKDGNKANNNIDNLEWCTNRDNTIHAYATGLKKLKHSRGVVRELSNKGLSQYQIARELGMDQSTISRILSGKTRRYAQ